MKTINIAEKFSRFTEHYKPKIVGELNDCYVKLVKIKGEFLWHHHESEDELFLVTRGCLHMKFRDHDGSPREEIVNAGEFLIVPRGTEHLPYAEEETHVMLLEPKSTLNTGNVQNERTVEHLDRI